jgi:nucleoside-diphosphate-sugar epimerase
MKIFIAGASGAIGQPLVAELIRQRHAVTGMTRREAGEGRRSRCAAQRLRCAGA